jgi:peptidoglycan/LPS O-acetylase OafA/YrhL
MTTDVGGQSRGRIEFLDGYRGVAILLVLMFHAYARWTTVVPYGDRYAGFPLFRQGWLGVELFFLVSGYVILLTLEKCATAREFLARRWLRLFPAMLVCSLMIYATAPLFPERPLGESSLLGLLPGLTFIEPQWWHALTGVTFKPLEGSFWSLYVEWKFYLFAALFYYWKGSRAMIVALVLAFLGAVASSEFGTGSSGALAFLDLVVRQLSFEHFGWFAAGASFYLYSRGRGVSFAVVGVAMAVASAMWAAGPYKQPLVLGGAISLAFAVSLNNARLQRWLSHPFLQFFAFVSYPLYLLHENLLIALIVKLDRVAPAIPPIAYPLVVTPVLCLLAYCVAKIVEPRVKRWLRSVGVVFPRLFPIIRRRRSNSRAL